MELYNWLMWFWDTWVLVIFVIAFVGIVIWLFRPGARRLHEEAANTIFNDYDDRPKGERDERSDKS